MKIPLSIVLSQIKGGCFESTGPNSGRWWKAGKLIADWGLNKAGSVVINWHDEQVVAPSTEGDITE